MFISLGMLSTGSHVLQSTASSRLGTESKLTKKLLGVNGSPLIILCSFLMDSRTNLKGKKKIVCHAKQAFMISCFFFLVSTLQ